MENHLQHLPGLHPGWAKSLRVPSRLYMGYGEGRFLHGALKWVRVWDRGLTTGLVKALYTCAVTNRGEDGKCIADGSSSDTGTIINAPSATRTTEANGISSIDEEKAEKQEDVQLEIEGGAQHPRPAPASINAPIMKMTMSTPLRLGHPMHLELQGFRQTPPEILIHLRDNFHVSHISALSPDLDFVDF